MEKKSISILVYGIALFFMSCTINYNEDDGDIVKSESIPDSVMNNFYLIQMKDNNPYITIYAKKAQIYNTQDKTILSNAEFSEYDKKSLEIITFGKADLIEYYNDTEDAKLTGNLNFISNEEDIEMTGEFLFWEKEAKKISSNIDSKIKVVQDDGSEIEGYGFSADLRNSTFSFDKDIRGISK